MSASLTVLRYSALITGITYGILHRNTLQIQFDKDSLSQELHKRENWAKQAKAAWAAKNSKGNDLITDPEAPGFDLEKVLLHFEKA